MRAKIAGATLSLALLLSFSGMAFADDPPGEASNDPGIAALHTAIATFRQDVATLRATCTGELDKAARVICRGQFAALRKTFKESRGKAIDAHHAFRAAAKATKAAAPQP